MRAWVTGTCGAAALMVSVCAYAADKPAASLTDALAVIQAHRFERGQIDEARAAYMVAICRWRSIGVDVIAELSLGILDA